jgi:D-alanyl-D-alanine dipeptidase
MNRMFKIIINLSYLLSVLSVFIGGNLFPQTQTGVGEGVQNRKEFVKLQESAQVKILLKYASTDNFMKENLYGEFNTCYLHKEAFEKFQKAVELLKESKTGRKFILFDCLRPRSIQYKLWEKVKGNAKEPYVANPEKGSIHNFGFALDLSLLEEDGKELDMGTSFDDFSQLSEPDLEEEFYKKGKLSPSQFANRKFLRNILLQAGFEQRPNEWWHFDALSSKIVKKRYKMIE